MLLLSDVVPLPVAGKIWRRPLAFFAGIWTRWKSIRKVKEGETENDDEAQRRRRADPSEGYAGDPEHG